MNNYTPHTQVVAIKIVGYTNLSLLGKRQTLKVYKTKTGAKIAASSFIVKAKKIYKAANTFAKDFATSLHGMALKANFWAAKKALRVKGYCWSRYIDLCNAFRLLRLFNNTVCKDLKVSIN
jgi:hypothetical protein